MPPSTPYLYQDPSSNLCAYHSLYHFLDGKITLPAFLSQATTMYSLSLGTDRPTSKAIAEDGNDPSVVAHILGDRAERSTRPLSDTDFKYYSKMIFALQRPHFIAILKDSDGNWWNYDSLIGAPTKIDSPAAFIMNDPVREAFLGK